MTFRPFIPHVSAEPPSAPSRLGPVKPNEAFTSYLHPYGSSPNSHSSTHKLCICMQSPHHSFQLYEDNACMLYTIENLLSLNVDVYVAISPNINRNNPSYSVATKCLFQRSFSQVHLNASSSELGTIFLYGTMPCLTEGPAILTTSLWASKVECSSHDPSGHDIYSLTTIKGKNNKKLLIIAAYVAVKKEVVDIGTKSLFAQQMMVYEKNAMRCKLDIKLLSKMQLMT
jgi:hypothetical protein